MNDDINFPAHYHKGGIDVNSLSTYSGGVFVFRVWKINNTS